MFDLRVRPTADERGRYPDVSPGTPDGAAAEVPTVGCHGETEHQIDLLSVAGNWGLPERVEGCQGIPPVIATAGMTTAPPSVLAGLVPGIMLAAPDSTDYGSAAQGHARLVAALGGCAPGLVVANIENG